MDGRARYKEQTREALIAAAARLVAERGFAAASLDEIARAAGFTKGAVYAHFDSKESLLFAVEDEFEHRWLKRHSADADENDANWFSGIPEQVDWALFERELWLLALRRPALRGRLAERYAQSRAEIAATVIERYDCDEEQARLLAVVILALDIGYSAQLLLEGGPDESERLSAIVDEIAGRRRRDSDDGSSGAA